MRDGSKGPLVVEVVKRRVVARTDQRQEGHEEVLVVSSIKRDRSNIKLDLSRLIARLIAQPQSVSS